MLAESRAGGRAAQDLGHDRAVCPIYGIVEHQHWIPFRAKIGCLMLAEVGRYVPKDYECIWLAIEQEWRARPKDGVALQEIAEVLTGRADAEGVSDEAIKADVWDGERCLLRVIVHG